MSSRLARDQHGRLVAVISAPLPGVSTGTRFAVVGNSFEAGGRRIGFLGELTGRRPKPQDRALQTATLTGAPRRAWPADYPERARKLHASGLSCPKVAEQLGVPFGTAKLWLWPQERPTSTRSARRAEPSTTA